MRVLEDNNSLRFDYFVDFVDEKFSQACCIAHRVYNQFFSEPAFSIVVE